MLKDMEEVRSYLKPSLDKHLWPYPGVGRGLIENSLVDLDAAMFYIKSAKGVPNGRFSLQWGMQVKPTLRRAYKLKALCEVASERRFVL